MNGSQELVGALLHRAVPPPRAELPRLGPNEPGSEAEVVAIVAVTIRTVVTVHGLGCEIALVEQRRVDDHIWSTARSPAGGDAMMGVVAGWYVSGSRESQCRLTDERE